MDPRLHLKDNLDHARWRVRFVKSLLDVHQHCVDTSRESWWAEEADLLLRLTAAEEDLEMQSRDKAG
ncbi:hypothetical protein DES53_1158 [Roseimicrobium gellanilyticum]|uniref:Uncharacterized protein n=1 Tax=Roseimicrobium gellanilyticum TaxID=748857 RepID=A0A366H629_9BACT|nr:hypothetical protein [Roseimicrobium gellanilyticum]RBP36867.1 hypothetical protein DES53_1158 [Roseimicrobium gellanilyticum]